MTVGAYTAIVGDGFQVRDDVQCFKGEAIYARPVMEAKRYKVLSHLFVPADVTLWIDGNIWLREDPEKVAVELLGDADVAMFGHPYRATVWQEFEALRRDQRFAINYLQRQLTAQKNEYRAEGLPEDTQLFECSVIVRRNNQRVNRLNDAWWAQICRWQWRDQVSFPFALWKYGDVKVATIKGNARDHPLFRHVSKY